MHDIHQVVKQFIDIRSSIFQNYSYCLLKPYSSNLVLSIAFVSLQIRLKLQVVEKMLLWLEPWLKHLHAQLMETLNPTSNGTMTKLEERFQVGQSWKQGKVGASLVLEVTLLEHQSISHSA